MYCHFSVFFFFTYIAENLVLIAFKFVCSIYNFTLLKDSFM